MEAGNEILTIQRIDFSTSNGFPKMKFLYPAKHTVDVAKQLLHFTKQFVLRRTQTNDAATPSFYLATRINDKQTESFDFFRRMKT